MMWKSLKEASACLKIKPATLRSRGLSGRWPRKTDESSIQLRYLYFIPQSESEASDAEVDRYLDGSHVVHLDQRYDDDGDDDHVFKPQDPEMKDYIVAGGNYIFSIPSKPGKPWVVPKEQIETLVSMYSNDGEKATYNQISRKLGWHRRTVRETLKALGKTHDSLPFTDDQIYSTNEDSLVEDLIRRKEEKVYVRASRASWRKTQELADKALNWQRFVEDSLSHMVVPPPPPMPKWKRSGASKKNRRQGGLTVVSHATDLHYGKYGWVDQVGEEYSREVTRDRLMSATEELQKKISVWGTPDRVVLGVGGDWFHIDGPNGGTTKGTPQDHDGCYMRIFTEGCALARDHIEHWRQFAPHVDVKLVRGNHDYISTSLLVHWLRAVYANAPDVEIGSYSNDREYMRIGSTLLGLTHGDGVSDKDLGSLMALEAKEMWSDTTYRMWITGHWHSQIVSENYGVLVEHAPSLAGSDAWHKRNGYVGNRRALSAFLIDHEDGPFAKVLADYKK